MKKKITAVIVAAGKGTRMGAAINKVFLPLGEKKVIDRTLQIISESELIDNIVVVTEKNDFKEMQIHINNIKKPAIIAEGGSTRQKSVYNGLIAAKDADIVLIHDGARAMISDSIIKATISDCEKYDASAAGVLCKDTLKVADSEGFIEKTLDRSRTYQIQTPQVFLYNNIIKAHNKALRDGYEATDDCALYEKYIGHVKISDGSYDNLKLTTPEDMIIAENILRKRGGII